MNWGTVIHIDCMREVELANEFLQLIDWLAELLDLLLSQPLNCSLCGE